MLDDDLYLYWQAFLDLDTCRPIGMAAGHIPFTAIAWWTDRYCVSESQADRVTYVVMELDKVYLEHCEAKNKTDTPPQSGGKTDGRPKRPAQSSG